MEYADDLIGIDQKGNITFYVSENEGYVCYNLISGEYLGKLSNAKTLPLHFRKLKSLTVKSQPKPGKPYVGILDHNDFPYYCLMLTPIRHSSRWMGIILTYPKIVTKTNWRHFFNSKRFNLFDPNVFEVCYVGTKVDIEYLN